MEKSGTTMELNGLIFHGEITGGYIFLFILLIREAHQNVNSKEGKQHHRCHWLSYYIYMYIIYTYFTSSQFFQLSKHPMLWTTKSFRRHFWGIRFVAASSGEYRRSCLGSCYKMLKHTSEENMNWLCQRHILVDIYHIYICNYIYII